jgi:hypothetical protein
MPVFSQWSTEANEEASGELNQYVRAATEKLNKSRSQPLARFIASPCIFYGAPAYLFNAMIAPRTPFPIKGVTRYQGEANALVSKTSTLYERMLSSLIADWRKRWEWVTFHSCTCSSPTVE